MKKKLVVLILILGSFVFPINTKALSYQEINDKTLMCFDSVLKNTYLLDRDTSLDDVQDWQSEYDNEQSCNPDNSLLGDPNDDGSVAWLLQQLLNYIRIIGPIIVVILSSIEFAKIIIQSDDEAMAKAQKKLINRLILVAALFFIPTLVEVLLQLFGITADPTCGLR